MREQNREATGSASVMVSVRVQREDADTLDTIAEGEGWSRYRLLQSILAAFLTEHRAGGKPLGIIR